VLDQMFRPFEDRLVAAVAAQPGNRILDIGCGTGSVVRAVARRLGHRCTGVDISEAMIAAARAIAAREGVDADFIRADAQTHDFAPESFDMIVSRFGVDVLRRSGRRLCQFAVAAFAAAGRCGSPPGAAPGTIPS